MALQGLNRTGKSIIFLFIVSVFLSLSVFIATASISPLPSGGSELGCVCCGAGGLIVGISATVFLLFLWKRKNVE